MVSRRIFLEGLAGAVAALVTGAFSNDSQAAQASDANVTIDSVETPISAEQQAFRHIRLSGTQLERYRAMRALFGSPSAFRVEANVDHAGQVLLEAALNDAGRAVTGLVCRGTSYRVVVKAA